MMDAGEALDLSVRNKKEAITATPSTGTGSSNSLFESLSSIASSLLSQYEVGGAVALSYFYTLRYTRHTPNYTQ